MIEKKITNVQLLTVSEKEYLSFYLMSLSGIVAVYKGSCYDSEIMDFVEYIEVECKELDPLALSKTAFIRINNRKPLVGTEFKGMETNRRYTLEELGL